MDAVLVRNIKGASRNDPASNYGYQSWLAYWKKIRAVTTFLQCSNIDCPKKSIKLYGGYVQQLGILRIYITPLCADCSDKKDPFSVKFSDLINHPKPFNPDE